MHPTGRQPSLGIDKHGKWGLDARTFLVDAKKAKLVTWKTKFLYGGTCSKAGEKSLQDFCGESDSLCFHNL